MASTIGRKDGFYPNFDLPRYIRRETRMGVVISASLSALISLALFGGRSSVPMWGVGQWVFDFLPQSFMISLMCAAVPGLLTAARMRRGVLGGRGAAPSAFTVVMRGIWLAAIAALLGSGLIGGVVLAMNIVSLAPAAALGLKVAYGALLASMITPYAVRRVLFNGQ